MREFIDKIAKLGILRELNGDIAGGDMGQEPDDGNERVIAFVHALEKISAQFGVVVQVTGNVHVMGGPLTKVNYTRDPSSGDILPIAIQEPGKPPQRWEDMF